MDVPHVCIAKVQCGVCGQLVNETEFTTCENCLSMIYCSSKCKIADWKSESNDEHSHQYWCARMKIFMSLEPLVCSFPFSFASETASTYFTDQISARFLDTLGLLGRGLWKYECHINSAAVPWDSLTAPGADLHQFDALWTVTQLKSGTSIPSSWLSTSTSIPYEDAMLRAYVSPTIAIILCLPPTICSAPPADHHELSLVRTRLADWTDYYVWRGFTQLDDTTSSENGPSNPIAVLMHWPLTIYYILSHLMHESDARTLRSVLSKRSLIIHIIGVEHELSVLPVFKELEYLIRTELQIQLVFIGTCIDPSVTNRLYQLSTRLSVVVWRGVYNEFLQSCDTLPDVILGFNSGLAAYATWVPTLRAISELHVPTFFTDACLYSCTWGYRVVARLGLGEDNYHPESGHVLDNTELTALKAPVLNPFRSPLRLSSTGVRWSWFRNAFIFRPFPPRDLSSSGDFTDLPVHFSSLQV